MRTTTPATFRIEINEYAIKCFLENHWNDYIISTNLSINEESLFEDTTTHFTSENRLRFFKEIPEIDQRIIKNNIKAICVAWFDDFLNRDGNYKFNARKQY